MSDVRAGDLVDESNAQYEKSSLLDNSDGRIGDLMDESNLVGDLLGKSNLTDVAWWPLRVQS